MLDFVFFGKKLAQRNTVPRIWRNLVPLFPKFILFLMRRRARAQSPSFSGIRQLLKRFPNPQIFIFVFQNPLRRPPTLFSGLTNFAPELNVNFVDRSRRFPNVAHNAQRLQDDLFDNRISQRVVAKFLFEEMRDVLRFFPRSQRLRRCFRMPPVHDIRGKPMGKPRKLFDGLIRVQIESVFLRTRQNILVN